MDHLVLLTGLLIMVIMKLLHYQVILGLVLRSTGRSAPANVTTVLTCTVTNVSISDNGADYTCVQGLSARSDTVFLTVFGEFNLCICIFKYLCT